ncbi:glycoside hydrolase family 16 protein [Serendipita vermifera MAFF 305830]|uniref:Glycoside hydrolase family 16 protein n=1 Tax=Serendipita vermifera MAFF 305830 TaxID=933852 RepID=A0A0C3B814_SERVB|nr:glycoside hydrolase family 16 protein [Serendipita vermifera MAFF 305830]
MERYTHGLFILDVAQAPYGCGTWPAYWSTSEHWPFDGEIDIIENVHSSVSNQVSWHTTANCTLISPGNYTGIVGSTTCDHDYMSNTGCGIVDPSIASFGEMFNAKGGGVYAMKWDSYSIDVWFFYRTAIPNDILTGLPNPGTWPLPSASLSGLGCPIDTYFRNHMLIFDTTLCGDWAGTSYEAAGCPGTCAERVADPSSFVNATWSINSIKIYNQTVINTAYLDAGAVRTGYSFWAAVFALTAVLFVFL